MPTIYSALKFNKGMTPKVYDKDSATRIEHFDTITEVLRPFRTLNPDTNNTGQAMSVLALKKFAMLDDRLYAVGQDASTPANGATYRWDTTNFDWRDKWGFGVASTTNDMLFTHKGVLFGLRNSRYLYSMTTGQVFTDVQDLSAFANGFCDAIIHSKDGCAYFATDNKIHKLSTSADGTAGTGYSLALTLPNSNFFVRSLAEQGNYINIAGYDIKTGQSWSLIWDRDTSVVDLTESIHLGSEKVYHNATLNGQTFFVQLREDMSNSPYVEKPVLVIKYMNGNLAETLYEFPVSTFDPAKMGGKYVASNRLYFSALVKFDGEESARHVLFCLDYKGRLTIAQNMSGNAGTARVSGVFQQGESFWVCAGADGSWSTATTYATTAYFETNDIRSDNLSENIAFETAFISCEPLPSGATVTLLGRINEQTTFTTIKTFSTDGHMKLKCSALEAVNALNGLSDARQVRLRLESSGGAVINGFQAIFTNKPDKGNG